MAKKHQSKKNPTKRPGIPVVIPPSKS